MTNAEWAISKGMNFSKFHAVKNDDDTFEVFYDGNLIFKKKDEEDLDLLEWFDEEHEVVELTPKEWNLLDYIREGILCHEEEPYSVMAYSSYNWNILTVYGKGDNELIEIRTKDGYSCQFDGMKAGRKYTWDELWDYSTLGDKQ